MSFLKKVFKQKSKEEKQAAKPSEYPPIGTNWTNWKIYLQKNEEEAEEMSPDFYTRLGKSGIRIDRGDDKYYTVDEILNLKFGNLNSVIQREKKAFAIAALFSIVVANDTGEILYIGREQRNQFWHPRNAKLRKAQWMKTDGEEFDLQKRLEFFFNDEDKNLGKFSLISVK